MQRNVLPPTVVFRRSRGWFWRPPRSRTITTTARPLARLSVVARSVTVSLSLYPESICPRERGRAASSYFEVEMRSDAADFARFCRVWLQRLDHTATPPPLVGPDMYRRYRRYLVASGCSSGYDLNLRLVLRRRPGTRR
jgi:hypothetical protein